MNIDFLNSIYTLLLAFIYGIAVLTNLTRMSKTKEPFNYAFVISVIFALCYASYDIKLHDNDFIGGLLHDVFFIVCIVGYFFYVKPSPSYYYLFWLPISGLVLIQFAYLFIYITAYSEFRIKGEWKWHIYIVWYHMMDIMMMATLLTCKDFFKLNRWFVRAKAH
ncbi:hypothetical protein PALB_11070 [Pseudoalteromonas luteoviolacea B = ATCC 29581]|nr:hypothetical protein PALB_11070 [Pseudoalteromonas luteoviolacea B = ATCC 29581]